MHIIRVELLIQEELRVSGGLLGYRSMWRRLAFQGIRLPRYYNFVLGAA